MWKYHCSRLKLKVKKFYLTSAVACHADFVAHMCVRVCGKKWAPFCFKLKTLSHIILQMNNNFVTRILSHQLYYLHIHRFKFNTHAATSGSITRAFSHAIFFSHVCRCSVQRVRTYTRVIVISSSHVVLRNFVGHGYLRSLCGGGAEQLVERSE